MSVSILVVDDEPDVADLFRQHFRREARQETYVMHFARRHWIGLQRKSSPSLIAVQSDINMPGLAGHELAKQAKRLRPGVKPILISARDGDGRGFPLLRKPFLQVDLARVIRETTGL